MRHKTHLLFTWADELVHHPTIVEAVEDVIGPDILCWTTNFFIKEPSTPGFVSWHQDSTYWGLDPPRRRHRLGGVHRRNAGERLHAVHPRHAHDRPDAAPRHLPRDNLLTRGQEIAVEVDRVQGGRHRPAARRDVAPPRAAGARLASRTAGDRRIGFAIRYIPTYVRQTKVRDSATLVRGTDKYHHFELEPRPRADLDAGALAAHAEAVDRQVKALYQGTDKQEFRA